MQNIVAIILNYNDSFTTIKLIEKIKDYATLQKIVVVDNCSTDNSYEQLLEYKSNKIDVIKTAENNGYASGNNFGAFYAIEKYSPEYLLICNPDVFFKDDVPLKLAEALSKEDFYALAACKVTSGINIWKRPDYWGVIRSMFLVIHNIEKKRYCNKHALPNEINIVDVVEGSMFCIKALAFKNINGFDEKTFLYYEENIMSFRLHEKGYRALYLTSCTYDHLHAASIQKRYRSKAKAFKNYYSSLLVYINDYLKVSSVKIKIFQIFYYLAYIERIAYDIVNKFLHFK